jgi:hypothetical protein
MVLAATSDKELRANIHHVNTHQLVATMTKAIGILIGLMGPLLLCSCVVLTNEAQVRPLNATF